MARYIDADILAECLRLQHCRNCNNYNEIRCRSCSIDDAIDFIEDAPTADVVEVKHGEWITLEAEIGLYSCSLCGHKILRAECNYCPNCGAKMDGGETDEEMRV